MPKVVSAPAKAQTEEDKQKQRQDLYKFFYVGENAEPDELNYHKDSPVMEFFREYYERLMDGKEDTPENKLAAAKEIQVKFASSPMGVMLDNIYRGIAAENKSRKDQNKDDFDKGESIRELENAIVKYFEDIDNHLAMGENGSLKPLDENSRNRVMEETALFRGRLEEESKKPENHSLAFNSAINSVMNYTGNLNRILKGNGWKNEAFDSLAQKASDVVDKESYLADFVGNAGFAKQLMNSPVGNIVYTLYAESQSVNEERIKSNATKPDASKSNMVYDPGVERLQEAIKSYLNEIKKYFELNENGAYVNPIGSTNADTLKEIMNRFSSNVDKVLAGDGNSKPDYITRNAATVLKNYVAATNAKISSMDISSQGLPELESLTSTFGYEHVEMANTLKNMALAYSSSIGQIVEKENDQEVNAAMGSLSKEMREGNKLQPQEAQSMFDVYASMTENVKTLNETINNAGKEDEFGKRNPLKKEDYTKIRELQDQIITKCGRLLEWENRGIRGAINQEGSDTQRSYVLRVGSLQQIMGAVSNQKALFLQQDHFFRRSEVDPKRYDYDIPSVGEILSEDAGIRQFEEIRRKKSANDTDLGQKLAGKTGIYSPCVRALEQFADHLLGKNNVKKMSDAQQNLFPEEVKNKASAVGKLLQSHQKVKVGKDGAGFEAKTLSEEELDFLREKCETMLADETIKAVAEYHDWKDKSIDDQNDIRWKIKEAFKSDKDREELAKISVSLQVFRSQANSIAKACKAAKDNGYSGKLNIQHLEENSSYTGSLNLRWAYLNLVGLHKHFAATNGADTLFSLPLSPLKSLRVLEGKYKVAPYNDSFAKKPAPRLTEKDYDLMKREMQRALQNMENMRKDPRFQQLDVSYKDRLKMVENVLRDHSAMLENYDKEVTNIRKNNENCWESGDRMLMPTLTEIFDPHSTLAADLRSEREIRNNRIWNRGRVRQGSEETFFVNDGYTVEGKRLVKGQPAEGSSSIRLEVREDYEGNPGWFESAIAQEERISNGDPIFSDIVKNIKNFNSSDVLAEKLRYSDPSMYKDITVDFLKDFVSRGPNETEEEKNDRLFMYLEDPANATTKKEIGSFFQRIVANGINITGAVTSGEMVKSALAQNIFGDSDMNPVPMAYTVDNVAIQGNNEARIPGTFNKAVAQVFGTSDRKVEKKSVNVTKPGKEGDSPKTETVTRIQAKTVDLTYNEILDTSPKAKDDDILRYDETDRMSTYMTDEALISIANLQVMDYLAGVTDRDLASTAHFTFSIDENGNRKLVGVKASTDHMEFTEKKAADMYDSLAGLMFVPRETFDKIETFYNMYVNKTSENGDISFPQPFKEQYEKLTDAQKAAFKDRINTLYQRLQLCDNPNYTAEIKKGLDRPSKIGVAPGIENIRILDKEELSKVDKNQLALNPNHEYTVLGTLYMEETGEDREVEIGTRKCKPNLFNQLRDIPEAAYKAKIRQSAISGDAEIYNINLAYGRKKITEIMSNNMQDMRAALEDLLDRSEEKDDYFKHKDSNNYKEAVMNLALYIHAREYIMKKATPEMIDKNMEVPGLYESLSSYQTVIEAMFQKTSTYKQIADYAGKVDKVVSKVDDVMKELKSCAGNIADLHVAIAQYADSQSSAQRNINDKISAYNKRIAELNGLISNEDQITNKFESQRAESQLTEKKDAVTSAKGELKTARDAVTKAEKDIADAETAFENQKKAVLATIDKNWEEILNTLAKKSTLQEQEYKEYRAALDEKVARLNEANEKLKQEMKANEQAYQAKKQELENNKAAAERTVTEREQAVTEAQKGVDGFTYKGKSIEEIRGSVNTANANNKIYVDEKKELEEKVALLKTELAGLKKDYDEIKKAYPKPFEWYEKVSNVCHGVLKGGKAVMEGIDLIASMKDVDTSKTLEKNVSKDNGVMDILAKLKMGATVKGEKYIDNLLKDKDRNDEKSYERRSALGTKRLGKIRDIMHMLDEETLNLQKNDVTANYGKLFRPSTETMSKEEQKKQVAKFTARKRHMNRQELVEMGKEVQKVKNDRLNRKM